MACRSRSSPSDGDTSASDFRTIIAELAALDEVEFELVVADAARRLRCTISAVRRAVEAERTSQFKEHAKYEEEEQRKSGVSPGDTLNDPRGRVYLFVDLADLPDTAAALAAELANLPYLFDRGGPSRLVSDQHRGCMVAKPLTVHAIVNEAHAVSRPWKYRQTRNGELERQDITLPERLANLYLARPQWNLRVLDGIASAPLLHEDGTLRIAEGYDPATRLYCERVPQMVLADVPKLGAAKAALFRIRYHFRTLPFADAVRVVELGQPAPVVDIFLPPGKDESAFLVMLMTAVCRPSLPLAPGLVVRAAAQSGSGSGKGLLVRAICAIAFGILPSAMTTGGKLEELEKRLVAALVEASPVVFLDNVNNTTLKSDTLASVLTERPAYVRPLGQTGTLPLNSAAFIAATGNALTLSEDLVRRFISVELDAGVENPEARNFQGDFVADTLARRAELLADVLTIWRWGRLTGDAVSRGLPLGSFTAWGRWCRDPLLSLGCADPVLRIAESKAKDPRRRFVTELFEAWWDAHGDQLVSVFDLAQSVKQIADPENRGRQYLRTRIDKLEGTRAAGFRLVCSPSAGKWNADLFGLVRTGEEETHRTHRTYRGHSAAPEEANTTQASPTGPMGPMPTDTEAQDTDANSRFGWGDTL